MNKNVLLTALFGLVEVYDERKKLKPNELRKFRAERLLPYLTETASGADTFFKDYAELYKPERAEVRNKMKEIETSISSERYLGDKEAQVSVRDEFRQNVKAMVDIIEGTPLTGDDASKVGVSVEIGSVEEKNEALPVTANSNQVIVATSEQARESMSAASRAINGMLNAYNNRPLVEVDDEVLRALLLHLQACADMLEGFMISRGLLEDTKKQISIAESAGKFADLALKGHALLKLLEDIFGG